MLNTIKKGTFSGYFAKQLTSLSNGIPRAMQISFILALPGNQRFHYLDNEFLFSEISDAFNKICKHKVTILYIKASKNDDHFIEVCVSTKS